MESEQPLIEKVKDLKVKRKEALETAHQAKNAHK